MKLEKKEVIPVEDPEEENEFYYQITAENGDINITINANRGSTVNINRGQPPPSKPPGT